jgi:paraquat-inducible protein B
VRTQSLLSLLIGGLAFDTPEGNGTEAPAPADTAFPLYGERATAMKQPEAIARRYVLYANESLRGLSTGAPVTILGLPTGEVTEVGLDIDPATHRLRGRIEVVALPAQMVAHLHGLQAAAGQAMAESGEQAHAFLQRLIDEQGLRAQLRSGSLLTGQLYVAFDFFPDAAPVKVDWSQETPVLPLVPSTLPDLEAKVSGILAKLDQLPFAAIGADVKQTDPG